MLNFSDISFQDHEFVAVKETNLNTFTKHRGNTNERIFRHRTQDDLHKTTIAPHCLGENENEKQSMDIKTNVLLIAAIPREFGNCDDKLVLALAPFQNEHLIKTIYCCFLILRFILNENIQFIDRKYDIEVKFCVNVEASNKRRRAFIDADQNFVRVLCCRICAKFSKCKSILLSSVNCLNSFCDKWRPNVRVYDGLTRDHWQNQAPATGYCTRATLYIAYHSQSHRLNVFELCHRLFTAYHSKFLQKHFASHPFNRHQIHRHGKHIRDGDSGQCEDIDGRQRWQTSRESIRPTKLKLIDKPSRMVNGFSARQKTSFLSTATHFIGTRNGPEAIFKRNFCWLFLVIFTCVPIISATLHNPKYSANIVKTKYGQLRGIIVRSNPTVEAYLGVPYATPPIGSLR